MLNKQVTEREAVRQLPEPPNPRTPSPPLGVHVSVAGGLETGFARAVEAGCDCMQIFVKNQRQWRAPKLTEDQITRYKAAQQESGLCRVVAHASYLLNLAAPGDTRRASVVALIDELERCEALGVESLVFHPGAHLTDTVDNGIARIAESLNEITLETKGFCTMILLETTAGQGTSIGWQFEQIAAIRDRLTSPERVGVCLDTCHLFAAGYDIRSTTAYATTSHQMTATRTLDVVRCIHFNDSKKDLGSRVDRHDHIGRGKIGDSGFANFLNDPRWRLTPMILETAKEKDENGEDMDRVNLRRLRSLLKSQ